MEHAKENLPLEVMDWQLLQILQDKLEEEASKGYQPKSLKNIKNCCRASAPTGVSVYRNNLQTEFKGAIHCHSLACPVCAVFRMQNYKSLMKSAFAMTEEQNLACFMVTYQVPHFKRVSKEKSEFGVNNSEYLPFWKIHEALKWNLHRFLHSFKHDKEDLQIKYSFYVMETTYGKRGWHPHFHVLYWLPKENLQDVANYEEKWRTTWAKGYEHIFRNYYGMTNKVEKFVAHFKLHNNGVFVSKNQDGKITKMNDSNYFWSATQEITGLKFKKGRVKGQKTIWQLLNEALKNNNEKSWELWKEYVRNMFGYQPYRLSRGFKQMILDWEKENPEKTEKIHKKKSKKTEFIIWFPRNQWDLINEYIPDIKLVISKLNFFERDPAKKIAELADKYKISYIIGTDPIKDKKENRTEIVA